MAETIPNFPNDPVLVKLLQAAKRISETEVMIKDFSGNDKTYPEILNDVLKTRDQFRSVLPDSNFDERGLLREENVFVTALTRTGYEFVVAFFAVRALGGAYLPLDPRAAVERQADVISRAKSNCVVFDGGCVEELERLCAYVQKTQGLSLAKAPITFNSPPLPSINISIDESLYLDPDGPGYVCMTSGTTGYSKGVVIRRTCLTSHPVLLTKEPIEEQPGALINYNESHWLGGAKNCIEGLALGKKVFALEPPASAKDVLEVFQNNEITYFLFNPALLRGMKDILLGDGELTEAKREEFSVHFKHLGFFLCIGGLVDQPTVDFWEAVLGLPLQNRYGASELAGLVTVGLTKTYGSLGELIPGVDIKLSEGSYGNFLVKSPDAFLGYLGNEEATKAVFDEEGYYKTGDIAEIKNGELLLLGRERDDYIVYGQSRTPTVMVERALMKLPYIHYACVVAVPVAEKKQLCGAVITVKAGTRPEDVTLARVRADLTNSLDFGMLPTVLRHVDPDEDLPRTATGKPMKRQVIEDFFYDGDCGRDFFSITNPPRSVEFNGMPVPATA